MNRSDVTTSTLALILFKALRNYDDDHILNWLQDDDPIIRQAAATELHFRPSEQNFQHILVLGKSTRHEHRVACAVALSQFGTPTCDFADRSFDLLAELTMDLYFEVRASAIHAIGYLATLGKCPPTGLIQQMISQVSHVRPEVREALGFALLSIRDQNADLTLRKLADDDDSEVREAAEFSLASRIGK